LFIENDDIGLAVGEFSGEVGLDGRQVLLGEFHAEPSPVLGRGWEG